MKSLLYLGVLLASIVCISCKTPYGDQSFSGDIYVAIPTTMTYTSMDLLIIKEDGTTFVNRHIDSKDRKLSEDAYLTFSQTFPASAIANKTDIDVYSSELAGDWYSNNFKVTEGYQFTGILRIYDNATYVSEYTFALEITDNYTNNFDFTLNNTQHNKADLQGYFHSVSQYDYSL